MSYYRVSTDRQEKTKLGLDAQRDAIARHIQSGGNLIVEFTEIESGKSHKNRPQLIQALEHPQEAGSRGSSLLYVNGT